MEEVTSNMTIAVMMVYLDCHEMEEKCENRKAKNKSAIARELTRFTFFFLFMTIKIHHHDRNGHIASNFFHF